MNIYPRMLALTGLLLLGVYAVGCNTVKGAGTDLQHASDNTADAIEDAAD